MSHDDAYIVRANIERFRALLLTEIDSATATIVRQLLAEFETTAARQAVHVPAASRAIPGS